MHYRLLVKGRDGRFSHAIDLDCESDEHAWEAVVLRNPDVAVELWEGDRFVGSMPPVHPTR